MFVFNKTINDYPFVFIKEFNVKTAMNLKECVEQLNITFAYLILIILKVPDSIEKIDRDLLIILIPGVNQYMIDNVLFAIKFIKDVSFDPNTFTPSHVIDNYQKFLFNYHSFFMKL
jgi:hypothetical protein